MENRGQYLTDPITQ
ncbi:unnamed protein product [Tuber melanosporum]|uniref:(Perigord truffle) hypothetical protein n=1 Tax=Tuber melanosporum (strain Mel28) TaxID=656061 RepID=D5GIC2_TUBMM|nr:unnamed protein product [Tuber melanosporum]